MNIHEKFDTVTVYFPVEIYRNNLFPFPGVICFPLILLFRTLKNIYMILKKEIITTSYNQRNPERWGGLCICWGRYYGKIYHKNKTLIGVGVWIQ